MFELSKEQINELARGIVNIKDQIEEFCTKPENIGAYKKWYLEKYGYEPDDID